MRDHPPSIRVFSSKLLFHHVIAHVYNRYGVTLHTSWHNINLKAVLVEVKGPGDKLSDRQHAWIARLAAAGTDIHVAYVAPK